MIYLLATYNSTRKFFAFLVITTATLLKSQFIYVILLARALELEEKRKNVLGKMLFNLNRSSEEFI